MSQLARGMARASALALLVLVSASSAWAAVVIHIRVEGVINPIKARYVPQAIESARDQNAAFLIMSINTPVGLVSSMEETVGDMTNAPIPIVGFLAPATAQATSAGESVRLRADA